MMHVQEHGQIPVKARQDMGREQREGLKTVSRYYIQGNFRMHYIRLGG